MLDLNKFSIREVLITVVIFYSNLTYIPFLTEISFVNYLTYSLWLALFLLSIPAIKKIDKKVGLFYLLGIVFIFYILLMELLGLGPYITSRFVYPVLVCTFVFTIGLSLGHNITEYKLLKFFKSYLLSATILGVVIYFGYFVGVDWLNSLDYIIVQKNGITMIFLISFIITVIFRKYLTKKQILSVIFISFFLMIILKSRAVLISLFIFIAYELVITNYRYKKTLLIIAAVLIAVVIWKTDLDRILLNNIIFNNRFDLGLNEVTSGRINHWNIFKENFNKHPIFGVGTYYLESFPLASLMSYGLVGTIPLLGLSLIPIYYIGIIPRKDNLLLRKLVIVLWFVCMFNGFFEELSPFGPGVKNYLLWFTTGIFVSQSKSKKDKA